MTDYYAVLKKAISGLEHESGEVRRSVYDKARTALIGQLKSIQPPLTTSEISRQRLELEEAIRKVEREAAVTAAGPVPSRGRAAAAAHPVEPPPEPEAELDAPYEEEYSASGYPEAAEFEPEPEPEPAPPPAPRVPVRASQPPPAPRPIPTRVLPDATVPIEIDAVDDFYEDEERPAEPSFQPPPQAAPGASPRQPQGRQVPPRVEPEPAPDVAPWVPQVEPRDVPRGRQQAPRREPPFSPEPDYRAEPSFAAGPNFESGADDAPAVDPAGEWQESFDDAPTLDQGFAEEARERRPTKRARAAEKGGRDYPEKRRSSRWPVLILLILIGLIAGGIAALAWSQRSMVKDVIGDLISSESTPPAGDSAAPLSAADSTEASSKNADRLGGAPPEEAPRAVRTVDAGPAPDDAMTPMASAADSAANDVTPSADEPLPGVNSPAAAAAPAEDISAGSDQALVAQKAILYEQPTGGGSAVTALNGNVVWKFDPNSSNGPEIQAQADIPDRKMKFTINIRKNTDASLPASHLVEVIVDTPSDFAGGGIKSVPAFVMKPTEEARGQPLDGAPAKVADGFFWIAFSNEAAPRAQNIALMRERNWIDIPLIYDNDQRAILTLEKGTPGQKAFSDALAAWGE